MKGQRFLTIQILLNDILQRQRVYSSKYQCKLYIKRCIVIKHSTHCYKAFLFKLLLQSETFPQKGPGHFVLSYQFIKSIRPLILIYIVFIFSVIYNFWQTGPHRLKLNVGDTVFISSEIQGKIQNLLHLINYVRHLNDENITYRQIYEAAAANDTVSVG